MNSGPVKREIIIPGEEIGTKGVRPGYGAFIEGDTIYSSLLGIKSQRRGQVGVIRLSGRYMPSPDDFVIGIVIDRGPSHWLIDINAPYPAALHPAETPWRIDFGDTGRFLEIGDTIIALVLSVDEIKRIQLTMQDHSARRLASGQLVDMSPAKIARLIGQKGSMIAMLKDRTNCRLLVGQNGRVWIEGNPKDMVIVSRVIELIEEHAQVHGLTETIKDYLEAEYAKMSMR